MNIHALLMRGCRKVGAVLPGVVVGVALVAGLSGPACGLDFLLGEKEIIYTQKQRKSLKLSTWPDGNLGVVRNAQGGYDFYGANGGSPVKTSGTLLDPGRSKQTVSITGVPKKTLDYVSGGPIYEDPTSGARLMIYHAERHGKTSKQYYSMLGMAVSTDPKGLTFRDLGVIIQPNVSGGTVEIGGGTSAVLNGYLNVYFRDTLAEGGTSELAVARAPLADVISNALNGQSTSFTKYYNGGWTEPGVGGRSSALEAWNPSNMWASVSYNDYLNQLVLVTSQWSTSKPDMYISASSDGVNWTWRQELVADAGEQFYPTLIGTGADPTRTGQSFYVYYTDSKAGSWNRWSDAQLVRRQITLDPMNPPVNPYPSIDPPGPVNPPPAPLASEWASVASYGDDFQTGAPADGWQYMWNPTGTRGGSTVYTPLMWSDWEQAYNTTGGATTMPGKKNNPDDYLMLTAAGGHPGRPKFSAIAGYTIQPDDGDGLYRLVETSIQKVDGKTSSKEDGLAVLVYVNGALVGSSQTVSTKGLLANFDRELGQLSVGDTVWVMVDPLKTQAFDGFMSFDFAIQKSIPVMIAANVQAFSQLLMVAEVPEPTAAVLLLTGACACLLRRRRS